MKEVKEILGYKYQIYEEDKLKIYRVNRFKNYNTVVGIEENTKEEKIISKQELIDKYVKLIPDAFMNIMVTDKIDNPDVYVCVNKASNLSQGKKVPDVILRQSIYSVTKTQFNFTDKIYVGDCISESTNMSGYDLSEFMDFEKIDFSVSVALYVDDTIDSIICAIGPKALKCINTELAIIKSKYGTNPMVEGYVDNLKTLMENNNFINRYREEFNILQVDWPIELGKESYNANGDIILNNKQHKRLEDELRKFISNVKVIKYDKDIDVSRIVSYKHSMISDSNQIIYLIAYDVDADYPVDNDISTAMQ